MCYQKVAHRETTDYNYLVGGPGDAHHTSAMPKSRKTWRDKLADDKDLPKVARIEGRLSRRWGEGTFVIPAPREVDELMRQVPKGRLTTIDDLRRALAARHGTTIACPLTTGIFAWIAAHAAEEARAEGRKRITPYWRTLKSGGEINPRYPGGIAALKRVLTAEGHRLIRKGRRILVADFDRKLVHWSPKAGPLD